MCARARGIAAISLGCSLRRCSKVSVETEIRFKLNGSEVHLKVPVTMKVLQMLRDKLGMTGTKYACGEGECGACTIKVDGSTINSCLMYAVDCDGREIVTIEGLRSPEGLNPMQQAFVDHGAIQCGFCMPGMIMQADYLVESNTGLTREQAQRGLEGNLCRCTGYTKVLDAVASVVEKKKCHVR
ncbi:MAG: (2Fe-2S)-binding protein [Proteobacteria bacterium]|nr:(2Fe-2S)-binding protein [Pseudomonadota bacterium]